MADILIDNQTVPSAPASGKGVLFFESGGKRLAMKDDSGRTHTLGGCIRNHNTADVTASGADTYITGSALTVPTGMNLQVGTAFSWSFAMSKTAAGTAAPVWTVRVGTNASTADTAILTFTSPSAQTAVTDNGVVYITAVLRNTGGAGVLAGVLEMTHANAATGLASVQQIVLQVTSGGFTTTTAGLSVGVSVNPGAGGVWAHQVVLSEMYNI